MRKTLIALSAAAALTATAASPVLANQHHRHNAWVAPAVGVAAGTAVGIGLYEGWFSTNSIGSLNALGATTGGAIAGGLVAGVGTVALIHAATTPCQGFQALFMMSNGCVNGQYVGDRPVRVRR